MVRLALFLISGSVVALAGSSVHYSTKRHVAPWYTDIESPPLPTAAFATPIVARAPRRPAKAHALRSLLAASKIMHTADLLASNYGFEYLVPLTVGGQQFSAIVDTGSSDTWVAKTGFECFNLTGHREPQSTCAFGSAGFNTTRSKTYEADRDTRFSITYADGECLMGIAAYDTVEVAGLAVTHQEIGVVSHAAWLGDGVNTGLLGLAYPGLTSVSNTSDHDQPLLYNPFFFSAVGQNKVPHPYFSISLNRADGTNATHQPGSASHSGYLAFGGIAPVPVIANHTATLPVQGYSLTSRLPTSSSASDYTFFYYTVDVQGFKIGSSATLGANNNTILDSGTTLSLLPSPVAQAFNKAFRPPARWELSSETYYVACNATAPPFAVQMGGKAFNIDARDLIVWVGRDDNGDDLCVSGVQDGGEGDGTIFILGDVFLHNVVATFDIKQNRVTVTQRQVY